MDDTLIATAVVDGWQATFSATQVILTGSHGQVLVDFDFPAIGRPHFPEGSGQTLRVLPTSAIRVTGEILDLDGPVRTVLDGRLALLATRGADATPITLGDMVLHDGGAGFELLAPIAERVLYDIALRADDGSWARVAPHAVYHRKDWSTTGIAHITDPHVARRIDRLRPLLRELGNLDAAQRLINFNDRFRGFVRFANQLRAEGHLDVIVATGDLIDYQYEARALGELEQRDNARFLRELLLGRAPGPDFPDVAELRVPILLTPGNHDYRRNPYALVFDAQFAGVDVRRVRNFAGYALTEKEALAVMNAGLDGTAADGGVPGYNDEQAARMVAVDAEMRSFRDNLAPVGGYVANLGPHRVVLVDSSHDVGMVADAVDAVRVWLGGGSDDEDTFVGGSPNCEGVSGAELQLVRDALDSAPAEGVVMVALHAPLANIEASGDPYYLRSTVRPADPGQVQQFLLRHSGIDVRPDSDAIVRAHPSWYGPGGEPSFISRGASPADLLDDGVSRGAAVQLLQLLAGVGGRRNADVVLAGHTHRHSEMVMRRLADGELAFFADHFTQNPGQCYPTPSATTDDAQTTAAHRLGGSPKSSSTMTYVEIDDNAVAGAQPWPLPYSARHGHVVQVPPYPDPLAAAADPRGWWDRHRPLLLQTGALGPRENAEVTFTGFRLLSIRDNVIENIGFVPMERLEGAGFGLPLADAIRVDRPQRPVAHREVTRRFGAPVADGAPAVIVPGAADAWSVVYRDAARTLTEVWYGPGGSAGAGRLSTLPAAHSRTAPTAFVDAGGTAVTLFVDQDRDVRSLYWNGPAPAGLDNLGGVAGAPKAAGAPAGWQLAGGNHVVYRRDDGHVQEIFWTAADPTSTNPLSTYANAPTAAGDPMGYPDTAGNANVVVYRAVDSHIHSLYWSDGPTGHDNLSRAAGSPPAAGDPVGYHLPQINAHQVTYRGVDGYIYELYWQPDGDIAVWNPTWSAGAPPAVSDPAVCYVAASNVKHIVYRSADGHLHDLAWVPGAGAPLWTDLTASAAAPPATERPAVFTVPGSTGCRVVFRRPDGQLHELIWG